MKKIILLGCSLLIAIAIQAQDISLERVNASNVSFDNPVNIQNAGDERLFILEQDGIIQIMQPDGSINSTPFLDISANVNGAGERGLLGLAFHPDYQTNGFFYLYYSKNNGDSQVSRFSVTSDEDVADPASEVELIEIAQPFGNHNGGCILFGPDGMLYIASGDGGSSGDPGNRSQNTELLLGKLLRIDVDNPSGGNEYGIPTDNPFAGSATNAEEIWALGLRNPWKFSFDSMTGDIWIADVGQGEIEEINKEASTTPGLNYGWRCYEGDEEFNLANCPDPSELTFPVAFYPHPDGFSITGGYVYRGSVYQDLMGLYIFADFATGLIGTVDEANNLENLGTFGGQWSTFGEDVNGEVLIADYSSGNIFRIQGNVLSVPEIDENKITLSPNPAKNFVQLSANGINLQQIDIVDIKGSILVSEIVNASEKTLNISDLSSGIYMIRIATENGSVITKKLVVK